MPQILMNFQHNHRWWVHFIEADCKTTIGQGTRYIRFEFLPLMRNAQNTKRVSKPEPTVRRVFQGILTGSVAGRKRRNSNRRN
jgi:hypothetical protein